MIDCFSQFRLLPLLWAASSAATHPKKPPQLNSTHPNIQMGTNQSDSSVKRLSAPCITQHHHRESKPAEKPEQSNLIESSHRRATNQIKPYRRNQPSQEAPSPGATKSSADRRSTGRGAGRAPGAAGREPQIRGVDSGQGQRSGGRAGR